MNRVDVDCAIAGGGPAGMMLALLLARAGLTVTVLEKHGDFLRDFRGDTIHPSTLQVMYELGILEDFLKLPHQKVDCFKMRVAGRDVAMADFSALRARCPYVAFLPQWDFLRFLADRGRAFPGLRILMSTEVTDLIRDGGRVVGVRAKSPEGEIAVHARLVVAADGRNSTVRRLAGLEVHDSGAPIDVLWTRISRKQDDPSTPLGTFERGRILILIDRGDYYQMGFVIRKGGVEPIRSRGIEAFRAEVGEMAPFLKGRTEELRDWEHIKLLTVRVDHLRRWYEPGLLCLGDAAHAMSPVGGVGINLAIQDAVAAGNLLTAPLRSGKPIATSVLKRLQRRRQIPARLTQRFQVYLHKRFLGPTLAGKGAVNFPFPLNLVAHFPRFNHLPARLIGIGILPEHVRS